MPLRTYKTGISSLGMDETVTDYFCDGDDDCKYEAEYPEAKPRYCEEHWAELCEMREMDRMEEFAQEGD